MQQHTFQETQSNSSGESLHLPPGTQDVTDFEEADTNALADTGLTAEAASLTALLQKEAGMRRTEDLAAIGWALMMLILMLWLATMNGVDLPTLQRNLGLGFGLFALMGFGLCTQYSRRLQRRKRAMTGLLSKQQDIQQVGALVHTLRAQHSGVRNLAKHALIELLPNLRASDAALLGASERTILLRRLAISPSDPGYRDLKEIFSPTAFRREVDLRVSILKALEQVGGPRELPTVEGLARGLPTVFNLRVHDEIQAAAKQCLPYLQARAYEQRAVEQLLRPSSPQVVPDDVLLRPAAAHGAAVPEQLLRASEPES